MKMSDLWKCPMLDGSDLEKFLINKLKQICRKMRLKK